MATTQQYPYVGMTGSCRSVLTSLKIQTYTSVNTSCTALATALATQPVSVNVDASNWVNYKDGVFSGCPTIPNLNHAVLLVGAANNVWTLKNSWGTQWGMQGFIQLPQTNACGVCTIPLYAIV
jgi:cathepsin L